MANNNKIIGGTTIALSILIVLAILGYIFRKKLGLVGNGNGNGPIYQMSYLSNREGGAHVVHLLNRPPKGTIVQGDRVKITKTSFDGEYVVAYVFIDASNNVGGIYLRIPYSPQGQDDKKFENIGKIELL